MDEIEGIDSREIVIKVFNKCNLLNDRVNTLFIEAMGTNGLTFPYEVITAEILNCFGYAMCCDYYPHNLYYSVREADTKKAGLTVGNILSYITKIVQFFKR